MKLASHCNDRKKFIHNKNLTLLANSVTFSTVEPMISEYRGQDVFLGPKYLLSYIHNLRIRATSIEEKMTGLEVSLIRSFKKIIIQE